ncbi:MAG: NAD(P)-dependent oxidoreductase [Ignavibacteriaceae bacterium]
MRIFITGGSGLLGQYLNIELSQKHQIITQYNSNTGNCSKFDNVKLDLTSSGSLESVFIKFKPETVIHTAAISHPASAENLSSKKVYEINVTATQLIANLCKKYNAKMIYTSTDLVYAGYRGSFLNEDAKLIPVSLYAETKLMGEVKIQQTFDNYIILRTALLYGFGLNHSMCHFQYMYENLKEGKEVKLFVDQFRSPLSVIDAVSMINQLLEKDIKTEVINFGGIERVSRYELGEKLCKAAGFDKQLLLNINMDQVPGLIRVKDVSMNVERLLSYGIKAENIENSINLCLKNLKIKK